MLHTRPVEQQTRILKHIQANSQMENNTHPHKHILLSHTGAWHTLLLHTKLSVSVTQVSLKLRCQYFRI